MAWWTNYFPWLQFAQTLLEKPATCPSMRFLLQLLYPPTRTHTFARCSTGFTRKRVSCSNSDNKIIWTLGSPGQLVRLFAGAGWKFRRVEILRFRRSLSSFMEILPYCSSICPWSLYPSVQVLNKLLYPINILRCCWMLLICVSILCWFVDLPISFIKHGTTCISLLPQPSNKSQTARASNIQLFFLQSKYAKYSSPRRPNNPKQSEKKLEKTCGPRLGATFGPFKAPHAPGLEDPTKVTESWVLVTSGMANRWSFSTEMHWKGLSLEFFEFRFRMI